MNKFPHDFMHPNRPCIMGEHACKDQSQCFEPCGDLGHSAAHARRATPEEEAAIDAALGITRKPK